MKLEFILASTLLLAGCTTNQLRVNMYVGQTADYLTTQYGLSRGYEEANPNITKDNVLVIKLAVLGALELMAHLDEDNKDTYYKLGALGGYFPAVWNIYQIQK